MSVLFLILIELYSIENSTIWVTPSHCTPWPRSAPPLDPVPNGRRGASMPPPQIRCQPSLSCTARWGQDTRSCPRAWYVWPDSHKFTQVGGHSAISPPTFSNFVFLVQLEQRVPLDSGRRGLDDDRRNLDDRRRNLDDCRCNRPMLPPFVFLKAFVLFPAPLFKWTAPFCFLLRLGRRCRRMPTTVGRVQWFCGRGREQQRLNAALCCHLAPEPPSWKAAQCGRGRRGTGGRTRCADRVRLWL